MSVRGLASFTLYNPTWQCRCCHDPELVFEKGTTDSGGLEEPEVRPVLSLCAPNGTKKKADKAESCGDDAKGSQLPLNT